MDLQLFTFFAPTSGIDRDMGVVLPARIVWLFSACREELSSSGDEDDFKWLANRIRSAPDRRL